MNYSKLIDVSSFCLKASESDFRIRKEGHRGKSIKALNVLTFFWLLRHYEIESTKTQITLKAFS